MFVGYKFEARRRKLERRSGRPAERYDKKTEKNSKSAPFVKQTPRVCHPEFVLGLYVAASRQVQNGTRGTPPLVGHGSLGRDSMIFWIQSGGGCFEQRRLLKNANLRKSFEPPNVQVPQGPPCSARRFTIWRTVRFWYVTVHGSGGYGSSPLICICATCSPGGPNWRLMASSPSSTSVAFFNSNLWSLRFRR